MTMKEVPRFSGMDWHNPETQKILLAGLVGVLCLLLVYNIILRPMQEREQRLEGRLRKIQGEAAGSATFNGLKKEQFEIEWVSLQNRLSGLKKELSVSQNAGLLNEWLTNAIQESGLQLNRQQTRVLSSLDSVQRSRVFLSLQGRFPALQHFLKMLGETKKLFLLRELNISNPAPESVLPDLTIEITFDSFHLSESLFEFSPP